MAAPASATRSEIESLVLRFTEAFNRDDLDGVMSLMADDAVYDEFTGRRSQGRAAIREAFVPQLRGDYGRIRFTEKHTYAKADVPRLEQR